jgi:hypothetical protein
MGWSDFLSGTAGKLFGLAAQGLQEGERPDFKGPVRRSSMGVPYYLGAPDTGGDDFDFGLDTGLAGGMRRRPRMNVMNSHAARRAVRRLRGALKLLHRIERTMPHRKCGRQHTGRRFGRR